MRKFLVLFLAFVASNSLFAKEFTVDEGHSYVGFIVKHAGVSNFKGNFKKFNGVVDIDPKTFQINKITANIDVNSISAPSTDLENRLKKNDFFDTEKFTTMTFEMTKFTQDKDDKDEGKVEGYLTMKGVKKLIVLESEIHGIVDDGKGGQKAGMSLEGSINRFDFDVNFEGASVDKKVKFDIELELMAK